MNTGIMFSSDSGEWETPQDLFDVLNNEFSFDLDACASPLNSKCPAYITKDQDALEQPWNGTCWMNPPYGRNIGDWMEKAHRSSMEPGTEVVCLVPARTDTRWWWEWATRGQVRFLKGRLKFVGAAAGAPFPSAVVIFQGPRFSASTIYWDWRQK